jgi:hypothetical protein
VAIDNCVVDLTRILLIPQESFEVEERTDPDLTEALRLKIRQMLDELENEKDLKKKEEVDLFEFYKRILLKLKIEDPSTFHKFMNQGRSVLDNAPTKTSFLNKSIVAMETARTSVNDL